MHEVDTYLDLLLLLAKFVAVQVWFRLGRRRSRVVVPAENFPTRSYDSA